MQLLLLTAGLGLLWALEEQRPQLVPASSGQLLGKWHIQLWAGTLPIPAQKRNHPLPPFTFVMNQLQKLEFRMNLTKPIGCLPYKMSLTLGNDPGSFYTGWKHRISITFLPGKQFAIAYFSGTMAPTFQQMMMLMGRARDKDPEATRTFEEFVESKGLNRSDIARPPQVDACELTPAF